MVEQANAKVIEILQNSKVLLTGVGVAKNEIYNEVMKK